MKASNQNRIETLVLQLPVARLRREGTLPVQNALARHHHGVVRSQADARHLLVQQRVNQLRLAATVLQPRGHGDAGLPLLLHQHLHSRRENQLVASRVPPGEELAAGIDAGGVTRPARDLVSDEGGLRKVNGTRAAVVTGRHAALAVHVLTHGPHAAAAVHEQGVALPSRDAHDAAQFAVPQAAGKQGVGRVERTAAAQGLAVGAVAPAENGAGLRQGEPEALAERDLPNALAVKRVEQLGLVNLLTSEGEAPVVQGLARVADADGQSVAGAHGAAARLALADEHLARSVGAQPLGVAGQVAAPPGVEAPAGSHGEAVEGAAHDLGRRGEVLQQRRLDHVSDPGAETELAVVAATQGVELVGARKQHHVGLGAGHTRDADVRELPIDARSPVDPRRGVPGAAERGVLWAQCMSSRASVPPQT
ncbi:uncharacterized protein BcabD6B2_21180 [Babesia caballi]|uniref:Uncharacterized protein n=1 Tax=Babesia caballi TaxID=5871 RepID=A0AAV4LR72_BABCB|nr:hypothetical protein, conserved [Babesia caballi]